MRARNRLSRLSAVGTIEADDTSLRERMIVAYSDRVKRNQPIDGSLLGKPTQQALPLRKKRKRLSTDKRKDRVLLMDLDETEAELSLPINVKTAELLDAPMGSQAAANAIADLLRIMGRVTR